MSYRPLRNTGRLMLAACAVTLGSVGLSAQTAAPSAPAPSGPNPSRVDLFAGYSYFGAHGQVKPAGIRYSSVDLGAIGSGAYYFNKYAGMEVVAVANPDGQNDGFYAGYAGPIFRAPLQNFTLFAHGLAGGVRGAGPNNSNLAAFEHEPYTWGASLMAGGGMDYNLPFFGGAFGIRLFEADYRYIHLNFGPSTTVPTFGVLGGRANLSAAELSSGILLHLGHIVPPPPVTFACAITTPTGTVYPGDVVTITGTATNLNPKKDAAYSWTADGGATVTGTSNVASVDTKSVQPGTVNVKGHVSQGTKLGQFADCTVPVTVAPFQPPTITCSANPSTVSPGDSVTITSVGNSPQNRPLTYSYSSTAGSISGNTASATLTTTGVAPGSVTVTCNVVDDKGQTASTTTSVTVSAPPAPPVAATKNLCSISFDRDKKRPTRVDNEAKACLDDLTLSLQQDPQSKLAVAGNFSSDEKMGDRKAKERAVNEKAYLVSEKGVDASRISVYTGTAGTKSVSNTLIPAGANADMTGMTPIDESATKAQPRSAARGRRHHRRK